MARVSPVMVKVMVSPVRVMARVKAVVVENPSLGMITPVGVRLLVTTLPMRLQSNVSRKLSRTLLKRQQRLMLGVL